MKIAELKSCKISKPLFSKKCCDGSFHWEVDIVFEDRTFKLFVVHNPSYIKGEWYCTATLRIPQNSRFEINYGFSNYKKTSKYVLKAIILDLISFEKTGKFSKHVSGYHNMFSPKDYKN